MNGAAMDFLGSSGEFFARLDRARSLSAALAAYVSRRWPTGRRDAVAAEWRLTAQEARSVVEGAASKATIAKVFEKNRGGWRVALPVMAAVVGQGLDEHMQEERARYDELARRADALARGLRADGDLAAVPAARERAATAGERRSFRGGVGPKAAQPARLTNNREPEGP
jgi:hypothetical protein